MKSIDEEYCLPFDKNNPEFWMRVEHLGRYLYAADCIRREKAKIVLDVACADGYGCFEMAAAEEIHGVDYNKDLIERARNTMKETGTINVYFHNVDLNTHSLEGLFDNSPDLITCFETLEHLKDPSGFLHKLSKLIKQGGLLLLSVPRGEFEPADKAGKLRNEFHLHKFEREEIENMLAAAEFEVTKIFGQPYTNICMSLQAKACRDTKIERQDSLKYFDQSKEAMRYFARMFGIPSNDFEDFSYSQVFIAQKK